MTEQMSRHDMSLPIQTSLILVQQNCIEINRNQSLIVINTKIWQNVVSLIDCSDKRKNIIWVSQASLIFASNN
jgi:hypothetical protein